MNIRIDIKNLLILSLVFILFTAIGTVSHEYGHIIVAKSLGYETMEDFLPTGFDDMPYLQKVDAIVQTIAKGKEYVKDFYFSHTKELEHNYNLVHSTKVEELLEKRIDELLTDI